MFLILVIITFLQYSGIICDIAFGPLVFAPPLAITGLPSNSSESQQIYYMREFMVRYWVYSQFNFSIFKLNVLRRLFLEKTNISLRLWSCPV